MSVPKIGLIYPDAINKVDLNKPELRIPMTLKNMGVDTVILAPKNNLGKIKGLPKIVIIDKYHKDSTLNLVYQFSLALQLNKLSRREKLDVLLFLVDFVAAAIVKILNPKIKIVIRNDIEQKSFDDAPYPKPLIKLSFLIKTMVASLLITYTKYNYDMTVAFAPFTKRKMRIVRCPVSDKFRLKKHEGKNREKIILCVARITPIKRQDILIRSFSKLAGKYPYWKVRLVGPITDKEYFNKLKSLIKELGLYKKVGFATYIPQDKLREEYLKASIFCLPSDRESPAAVRGEAMAMGLPIVTTDTVGSEYVKGRGIVVPIGDEQGITDGLDRFMGSPKEREKAIMKERAFAEKLEIKKIVRYLVSELGYEIK